MKTDHHIHTKYSDGEHSPMDVIDIAVNVNLDDIAITDHDTLDGLEEALNHANNRQIKIKQGIEFSVDANTSHILGYDFDYKAMQEDEEYKRITGKITSAKRARAREMCKKSKEDPVIVKDKHGNNYEISLTMQEMDEMVNGRAVYTGHFGAKIAGKIKVYLGVTISQYDATRLFFKADKYEKFATTKIKDIDKNYDEEKVDGEKTLLDYACIEKGKKYWHVKEDKSAYPSAKQVINLIHKHKGIVIIAHPDEGTTRERVEHYLSLGADGIEVYSPKNNGGITYYQYLVRKYNLIATKGTDWHGLTYSPNTKLGG